MTSLSRRARRVLAWFLVVTMMVGASLIGAAAPKAFAADELEQAKERIAAAQEAADQAATEFDNAQTRFYNLQDRIQKAQRGIADMKRRASALLSIVRSRAIVAYKGSGNQMSDDFFGGAQDALAAGRRAVLLDRANARGQDALDEYRATTDNLRSEEASLRPQLDAQEEALKQMKSRQADLQRRLTSAVSEEKRIRTELERQRRVNEYLAIVRQVREAARARAARLAAASPSSLPAGGSSPRISQPPPSVGGMVCPVAGPVSFSDTYGSARSGGRSHKGVDMFAARGTPTVAILPGTVFYQADPVGGLSVYLQASDGNTYYYTHLNDYVGGARSVRAGEVLGHVGNTGNASDAPSQLHFERRIGGPNGERVNPYPTVRPIC